MDQKINCPCCRSVMQYVEPPAGWYASKVMSANDSRSAAYRFGREAGWTSPFHFLECPVCGFARLFDMPASEVLSRFYERYHPNGNYASKGERKVRHAARRLRRFVRLSPGRRFLDIGCNLGFAVEAAARMGLEATGIDVGKQSIEGARKMFPRNRFIVGPVKDLAGEQFDAVLCADVIEHCVDPAAFVRDVAVIAAPGAVLYIATPDIRHWRAPKPFWRSVEVKPPEHVCWFGKTALRKLLERYGFNVVAAPPQMKPGLRVTAVRVR